MQLSQLYSNKPELFEVIDFNCCEHSNTMNVVLGDVTDAKDEKTDSHNLGKTTLIHVIDFMFLKDISGGNHFFETHFDRFSSFAFCIEIALNSGQFVTLHRAISTNTQVDIKVHDDRGENFFLAKKVEWDHERLPLTKARELLDGLLDLTVIKPYDYRKALTYFLRTQADYNDVLQLQKFQMGQHIYWKPFVMNLFGFDEANVEAKYNVDHHIEDKEDERKKKEAELQVEEQDLLRLNAEINNLREQLQETELQLDRFEFSDEEKRLMHELVDEIEARIAEINDELYNVKVDLRNIEEALKNKLAFKVSEIETIFGEVNLHFPDQIKKSYEDLLNFNRSITNERNVSLRSRKKELTAELEKLRDELNVQDKKRQKYRSILSNSDTLDKFKALQKTLGEQRAHLTYLERQYEKLSAINDIEIEIGDLKRKRSELSDKINVQIKQDSSPRKRVAKHFNDFCKRVLAHEGLFYIKQNTSGNVEFPIELTEPVTSKASRQGEGKSYKQLVCALFDLALLKAYEDSSFYHFVYHDGILEGLDDRKKKLFLEVVRDVISSGRIQYILSLIDTDIPRDAEGNRIEFTTDEVVLRLHDGGDEGRLFKMSEF